MRSVLPVAPLMLTICSPGSRMIPYMLSARLWGTTHTENSFSCPHVGVYAVGLTELYISDCFGFFRLRRQLKQPCPSLTVLPRPRDCASVPFSPGEDETSSAQRAQADLSTPADIRAWQEGDELKRVHWKLSMRRQSLMVHTYETPERPDALVFMDCCAPDVPPLRRAAAIDVLTETTAGVLRALLSENRPVTLPLAGESMLELHGQALHALPSMSLALAQESFSTRNDFAAILLGSSRRMRRTGSTVILSCSLTPALADAAIALSRLGPHTRYVLIACDKLTDLHETLLALMQAQRVETQILRI